MLLLQELELILAEKIEKPIPLEKWVAPPKAKLPFKVVEQADPGIGRIFPRLAIMYLSQ